MNEMTITGRAWCFGGDVNTDVILPSQYMNLAPEEYATHVMEPVDPDFADEVQPGDFLVAKQNFGIGSSREQAVVALDVLGIGAVIAESFARIFYRNAINEGLPVITVEPDVVQNINPKDELVVDLDDGTVTNRTTDRSYPFDPPDEPVRSILEAGGAVNYYGSQ